MPNGRAWNRCGRRSVRAGGRGRPRCARSSTRCATCCAAASPGALPHDHPPWRTVSHSFRAWRLDGTWERLNDELRALVRERTFAWLGRYRRLSKDYEALPATEEAWIHLAMSSLMLARLAK